MHDTRTWRPLAALCAAGLAVGCATREAPDFSGRWQPVNRYAAQPQAIPIAVARSYRPTPIDRTLKAMLERWSADAGMPLDYRHGSDFLLHEAVAGIGAGDLASAVRQLDSVYATEGVEIRVDAGRLVVARRDAVARIPVDAP